MKLNFLLKWKIKYIPFFRDYVKSEIIILILLCILTLIDTICSIATPLLMKYLIDYVIVGGEKQYLIYFIIALLVIALTLFIVRFLSTYYTSKLSVKVSNNIRYGILKKLQNTTLMNIYRIRSGDVLTRIVQDIATCQQLFTTHIIQFINGISRIVLPLIIMIYLKWDLALICISSTVIYLPLSLFFGKRLKIKQRYILERTSIIVSFLKESLSTFPLIKTFSAENYQLNRFNDKLKYYYDSVISTSKTQAVYFSITTFLLFFPFIILFYIGGNMVLSSIITVGTFVAFSTYIMQFYTPINTLANLWGSIKMSTASFDRVNEVMTMEEEGIGKEDLVIKNEKIEMKNINFSYGSKIVFSDLSLNFKKGINFLIGDNGTGKTTIFNLLLKLYIPNKGKIEINGINIEDVKLDSIRKNISLLPQQTQLFDMTIYENILLGNLEANEEEVVEASKLAKAHDFISKLPKRYDTSLNEQGLNLSGGEKQKIALARAFLKNSPILLIDEAVSIDEESRKSLHETLRDVASKKIIIITTHDHSEIKRGDNVIDLNKIKKIKSYKTTEDEIPTNKSIDEKEKFLLELDNHLRNLQQM